MTSHQTSRFSEAVLALHSCQAPEELGPILLAAFGMICVAEYYSVNSVGSRQVGIFQSTKEFSKSELEVFNAHLPEHPLIDILSPDGSERGQRWSDHKTLRAIRETGIYHDFFRLSGTRYQMACVVPIDSQMKLGLAFNRTRRDFREEDVRLMEMLLPHVRQVAQRMIGQAEVERALALRELAMGGEAVLVVDAGGGLLFATDRARELLHAYFPAMEEAGLPLELRSWLRHNPPTGDRRTQEQPGRRLVFTCGSPTPWSSSAMARMRPGEDHGGAVAAATVRCVRLVEQDERKGAEALQKLGLTVREAEVLYWMAQGKRNSEIALILQMSVRTVDKHAEHLFAKLDVETRALAVALAVEALVAG